MRTLNISMSHEHIIMHEETIIIIFSAVLRQTLLCLSALNLKYSPRVVHGSLRSERYGVDMYANIYTIYRRWLAVDLPSSYWREYE